MGTLHLQRLSFGLLTVLLAVGIADATSALVGAAECSDCSSTNIKAEHAFRGLRVAINCKAIAGEQYETMAVGKLDKHGNFRVGLPTQLLGGDGELNRECFAALHGGANEPCSPTLSKIASSSKEGGVHTFALEAGKLPFSSVCTSAIFIHKYFPWHKPLPKFSFPHKPHFFLPIHKKPLPLYKPPTPVYKPTPTPVYKPPAVPSYEHPHPQLPPLYKKPTFPPHYHYKKPYTRSGEADAADADAAEP